MRDVCDIRKHTHTHKTTHRMELSCMERHERAPSLMKFYLFHCCCFRSCWLWVLLVGFYAKIFHSTDTTTTAISSSISQIRCAAHSHTCLYIVYIYFLLLPEMLSLCCHFKCDTPTNGRIIQSRQQNMLHRMWNFISLIWTDGFQLKYIVLRPVSRFYCTVFEIWFGFSAPSITHSTTVMRIMNAFSLWCRLPDATHITDP